MAGMHIRYNTTLKQYEYSLLGTDTGPWTKLDISGNLTGSLPANIAYTDVVNQFTMNQRISNAGGDQPRLTLSNLLGAVDKKTWQIINISDLLQFWALTDNEAGVSASLSMDRLGNFSTNGQLITPVQVQTPRVIFPGSQDPSSSPNCLDDYEEGSWTPTFNGDSGNSTGQVYSIQTGRYVKIGLQVYLAFDLNIVSWAVGAGGSLIIMSLPFYSDTAISGTGEVSYFTNCGRNVYTIYPHISPNGYLIYLYCKSTLSGNADGVLAFSELRANMRIIGSITYRAQG
jgi:hypothetical protein